MIRRHVVPASIISYAMTTSNGGEEGIKKPAVSNNDVMTTTSAAASVPTTPAADTKHDDEGGDKDKKTGSGDPKENVNNDSKSIASTNSIDDDDDDDGIGLNDSNDDPSTTATDYDTVLVNATLYKEQGNKHFADNNWDKSARSYRRGCQALTKLTPTHEYDTQVVTLFNTLQTNLSMVLHKSRKYKPSIKSASHVVARIEGQPQDRNDDNAFQTQHVKALYRRAVACRQLGDLTRARSDLRRALQMDKNNRACLKELAAIKTEIEMSDEKQKKALSKAFSSNKGGGLLYSDKEQESEKKKKDKEIDSQAEKKRREEELKQLKQEWEDECVKRMAANKDAISFDEWLEERKKKEEQERLEEERKRKEEKKRQEELRKKQREEAKAKKKQQQDDESDDDDDDKLTESEVAMMRGYKKTRDGRTTSYFTRELSQEDFEHLKSVDAGPKRLTEASNTVVGPTTTTTSSSASAGEGPARLSSPSPAGASSSTTTKPAVGPSAWNKAGTWEDKDTTPWCTEQLRKRMLETATTSCTTPSAAAAADKSSGTVIKTSIVKISDVSGHASIVLAGGKKRYIYEFNCCLDYEMKDADDDALAVSGKVRLPDICSTVDDELDVTFESTKNHSAASSLIGGHNQVQEMKNGLANELRKQVGVWINDFHGRY